MSSFSAIARNALILIAISAPVAALTGCTIAPVYSGGGVTQSAKLALSFPEPKSRLEQIVYQDLALHFSDGPAAKASVTVRQSGTSVLLTRSNRVNDVMEMKVTGVLTITRSGKAPIKISRFATATYTVNSQALANDQASTAAAEQATKALSAMFRLAILAELAQ